MILTYTPLEEAWDLGNDDKPNSSTHEQLQHHKNMVKKLQSETNTIKTKVEPSNSGGTYDSMTINLDGFNPTRIDVVISDPELIEYMQDLPYKEQQSLATNVLLTHFKQNPNLKINSSKKNTFQIPPNSTNNNMEVSKPTFNNPNSSFLHADNPLDSHKIEFYKANTSESNQSLFLYMVLAMLLYVLYEKLTCILKNR